MIVQSEDIVLKEVKVSNFCSARPLNSASGQGNVLSLRLFYPTHHMQLYVVIAWRPLVLLTEAHGTYTTRWKLFFSVWALVLLLRRLLVFLGGPFSLKE
mmetsp:Transcript_1412/g.1750  ORF Transcript_1412/g.1750 Transcript_1412/m.1750 type:complete len:99 (-) Transcript_1412:389-685(-)